MNEQLISFDTAKLAKEKGFDWKVGAHYRDGNFYDKELIYGGALYNMNFPEEQKLWSTMLYSAPTQSLLQKWLREKHNIEMYATVSFANIGMYNYEIQYDNKLKTSYTNDIYKIFKTFEEALEDGLQEALKLI